MGKDIANQGERRGRKGHRFKGDKILRSTLMNPRIAKPVVHGRVLKGLRLKFRSESCAGGNLRYTMLMRISHHPGHARQGSNLLRRALGIAARYHDFCG